MRISDMFHVLTGKQITIGWILRTPSSLICKPGPILLSMTKVKRMILQEFDAKVLPGFDVFHSRFKSEIQ